MHTAECRTPPSQRFACATSSSRGGVFKNILLCNSPSLRGSTALAGRELQFNATSLNPSVVNHQTAFELDGGLAVLLRGDESPAVANIARPQGPLQEEEFLKTFCCVTLPL